MNQRDSMISPMEVNPVSAVLPQTVQPQQQEPGKFSRIFGGILGGALNFVAPGAGSLIGSFIGGSSSSATNFASMEGMLAQQQLQSMQMLAVQNRVQSQTQEFTTVSNLLKARHDGEMSAVHNFKS